MPSTGCSFGLSTTTTLNLADMTVSELKEALTDMPDDAEVLLFESEDWQCDAVNESNRLDCEYLYDRNCTNRILFLRPI